MVFSDPFDSLKEDLSATFRPQREWAQRRGLLLISAHFLSGVGAGAWLFSTILALRVGLFLGLAIVLLGGIGHLAFLGRPERFWRIITRVQSSWVSRGLAGITVFSVFAVAYLVLSAFPGQAGPLQQGALTLSLVGAVWICVYKGFVWAVAKGIPFWNSPLLPAIFILYALRGGIAILFVSLLFTAQPADVGPLELTKLWIGVSSGALILLYLTVMPTTGITASRSVSELMGGALSLAFYLGVVFLGLVVPIAIGGLGYLTTLAPPALAVIGISSLVGDFYTIYCIARAGVYRPLIGEFPGRPTR
ncbi:MAG: polysulfide reductase NrfD [Chloroflexi bacterium]|nr:polysulfide reductase NrfD [Chloroflexota bacterium]